MKSILFSFSILISLTVIGQKTIKEPALQLKYTLPEGWKAEVYAGETPWEKGTSPYCACAGILFSKPNSNGTLKVMVYPSTISGLDSAKRYAVGALRFEKVEKYFKTTNKVFSFEKRVSYFTDTKSGQQTYEVIRYMARPEKTTYIIYTWQETLNKMDPKTERELFEMVNALEPIR